ncbi:hypothetical protein J6590_079966, partial [Homalodisca vitripennis]
LSFFTTLAVISAAEPPGSLQVTATSTPWLSPGHYHLNPLADSRSQPPQPPGSLQRPKPPGPCQVTSNSTLWLTPCLSHLNFSAQALYICGLQNLRGKSVTMSEFRRGYESR